MIGEHYHAGYNEALEKLGFFGKLLGKSAPKVRASSLPLPGQALPASSLMRKTPTVAAAQSGSVPVKSKAAPKWNQGSVIDYSGGAPTIRPRQAGEV